MGETVDTPRARALSSALREAQLASGIGVTELGRRLSMAHTQISLWLNGHRVPNVETVAMMLAALRVEPDERERILDLARHAKEPNWLTVGVPGVSQQLAGAVECERTATKIIEWSPLLVPGLLQTSDYARQIITDNGRHKGEVELHLMLRMGRREVLTRSDPVHFDVLLSELALLNPVVSEKKMCEQRAHLAELATKPNISMWVIPKMTGYHPGCMGPFVLYEFPNTTPVIHFEHYSSGAFVPEIDNVKDYQDAIETMKKIAIQPDESSAHIAQISNDWS